MGGPLRKQLTTTSYGKKEKEETKMYYMELIVKMGNGRNWFRIVFSGKGKVPELNY
jgi:hypothetical protein